MKLMPSHFSVIATLLLHAALVTALFSGSYRSAEVPAATPVLLSVELVEPASPIAAAAPVAQPVPPASAAPQPVRAPLGAVALEPEPEPEREREEPDREAAQALQPKPEPNVEPKPEPKVEPKPAPKPEPRRAKEPTSASMAVAESMSAAPAPPPVPRQATPARTDTSSAQDAGGSDARAIPEQPPAALQKRIPASAASYAATNRKPPYPRLARSSGEQGTVVLRVLVQADGTVGALEIAGSSGYPLLDESARRTVRNWRFHPATVDGKPVAEWHDVPILFTLHEP
jgi:periplasmic protein TonB